MDLLEKINRAFGQWYEGLFGGSDDVRPRDILRRILAAMEDNRKEGLDNRIYVPNQFILEINVHDEEQKEYLLSFLDRNELETAIRRYCKQNNYQIRGELDFTIKELDEAETEGSRARDAVRVRCRYNSRIAPPAPQPEAARTGVFGEDRTVASAPTQSQSSPSSYPGGALVVYPPNRSPFRFPLTADQVIIGRSHAAGCDLVIDTDGRISKRHARLAREADGNFVCIDLGSTNGTKVNGRRHEVRPLRDGDEMLLGDTRITYVAAVRQDPDPTRVAANVAREDQDPTRLAANVAPPTSRDTRPPAYAAAPHPGTSPSRLVLMDHGREVDDYLLASETDIGRGVTNDIVLPDRSIATRHARILRTGEGFELEVLEGSPFTAGVNGVPVPAGASVVLRPGDAIQLGDLSLRFDAPEER